MIQFVSDIGHYDLVLNLAAQARRALWIGTADIKDLYVRRGEQILPFLAIISELIAGGVKVRLIYAKEPGFIRCWRNVLSACCVPACISR